MQQTTKTRPVITKYELVKVLSARVQQLADGAPSTLPPDHASDPVYGNLLDVAVAELEEGKLPMMLPRELPDGTRELWRLDQLRLPKAFMRHVKSTSIL
jgi:DNA-directed RNA polymerase I, II, and III subunit RPABC2